MTFSLKLALVASNDLIDTTVTPSPDVSGSAPKLALVTTDIDFGDKACDDPSAPVCELIPDMEWVNGEIHYDLEDLTWSPDWPDWAQGVGLRPLDGLDLAIFDMRVAETYYLPWRTLPNGTRTYRIDGVGDDARAEFFKTLPMFELPDGSCSFQTPFSASDFAKATDLAQRATRDRLLMAAAQVDHGRTTSLASFLEAASQAFAFTDPATQGKDKGKDSGVGHQNEDGNEPDPDHDR